MKISDYHFKNDKFKKDTILLKVVRLFHSSEDNR